MKDYTYDELTPELLESLSSDDLDRIITGQAVQAARERGKASSPNSTPPVDYTSGMSGTDLFLAGMGREFQRIPSGVRELAIGAFGSPEEQKQYNLEKREQRKIDQPLMDRWPAKMGAFGSQAATAAMLPARLGPQILAAAGGAAASPTQEDISGMELPTRTMRGLEAATTTAALGYPLGLLGKAIGAKTQRYTPEGQEAMRLDAAARRLGVSRNVGGLDPSSSLNAFETNLPGYARTVEGQVKALSDATRVVKDIPSKTGRSFESRVLEGEKLREGIQQAGQNLQGVGNSLWNDLDSFIVQNNLAPVAARNSQQRVGEIIQKYTPITRKGMQLEKNPVIQRISEYDPDSAQLLTQFMANPKTSPQVPFSDLHKLSSSVGKALRRAEKDAGAPGASMSDRQVRTELKSLYGSLMSDVDSWGTNNPQAKAMFDEARTFWRDVVVPGVQTNKVVGKASKGVYGMNPRGYAEPKQLYSDVVGNPRAMQDIYPYMSQETRDVVDTISTMPDVARALTTNTPHPPPPGMGTITTLSGMLIGSPLQLAKGVVSHLPGARSVAMSDPAKRFYFARDVMENSPLGRASWAALQEPQQRAEGGLRSLRTREKP